MENEEIIKNAQYRKTLSIAFFNATNSAIELVKASGIGDTPDVKAFIVTWRDWFLEEHKEYYAKNIADIGGKYDVNQTIERLKQAKDMSELNSVWIGLSEDERQDKLIITEAQKLKKQLQ